jgi:DNA-binding LacI/PurR family transcriptional regulator
VGEETQALIVQASRTLGYQPNDPAMRVRVYPETGEFCYLFDRSVTDGIANAYHSRLFRGAASALGEDQHLAFAQSDREIDYLQQEGRLPANVRNGSVSRCILAGTPNYSLILALQRRGVRLAYASQSVPLVGVISVAPDYCGAATTGIGYLLARGHRRIAVSAEHYFGVESFARNELVRGATLAFAEAGLAFSADAVLFNHFGREGGNPIVTAITGPRETRPTAVFCFDDWTAINVIREAQAAGLSLPRDLSVVGVNDDLRGANLNVPLTTIHLPAEEIGALAVKSLLGEIVPQGNRAPTLHRLAVRLIERASVGPPNA